jgi:hypothetical protein
VRVVGAAYAVQFLLGLGALLSLAIKRHLERPRRPWAIFMADVSKQAFSALVAHFFNMGFSFVLKNKGQENECKWVGAQERARAQACVRIPYRFCALARWRC